MQNTNFLQAHFENLSVIDTVLMNCSLIAAYFGDSDWNYVEINDNQCSGVQFQTATLKNVVLVAASLTLLTLETQSLIR